MRLFLAAIATLVLSTSARAGHPPIVLESYVGNKPADAARVLSPLLDELATRKFVVGAEVVGRQFEALSSRPALHGGLRKDFAAQVTAGFTAWTSGMFNDAATILGPLVEAARENPGAFALDPSLQPSLQQAMIALSLSQLKLGDRGAAKQALAEALRGSPDLKLSRAMYGQDAAELFNQVTEELGAAGRGKVLLSVDADAAGIHVNERLVGMNKVELYLLPGEYRVVARIGSELSRSHKVVVKGGDIQSVEIQPALDRAVHTAPDWAGLRYESTPERERDEASHGAAFATAIDAEQVIVVGIDVVRGRRVVSGALINKRSGREFRRAIIPLDGNPPPEQFRNFARFLVGGPLVAGIEEVPVGAPAGAERRGAGAGEAPASPRWGGWKYVAGGGALAAGLAAGIVLSYHGRCTKQVEDDVPCPDSYQTLPQGLAAVGGAVVLTGLTVYLVVKGRGGGAARTAYLVPSAGGAFAGYAATF